MSATLITYNCKNIKRSIEDVRRLCSSADIIALQETWLLPGELSYLAEVHSDFGSTGTSAVDTTVGILKGRPFGGVALLWRKALSPCVSVIPCVNPRIAAIRVTTSDRPVLVFSVYMPTDCAENVPDFTDCVSAVSAIIDDSGIDSVFILGDFNAHPGERFYRELMAFSLEQDWTCVDTSRLQATSDTFTFISDAHGSKRWLDHCMVTSAALGCVTQVYVKYGVYWSDHIPLVVNCDLNIIRQKLFIKSQL